MDLKKSRTIVLNEGDEQAKREEIRDYFHATYSIEEQLYNILKREEAFYLRAEPLRHPLIFYLGHTAAFYINKLTIAKLINKRINSHFESMFAIGVDEMSWDDLNSENYDWPSVDEVKIYRQQVREEVDLLIRRLPLTLPINWDSPFWAIMMGIEHQRIHLETSSVIIRRIDISEVKEMEFWDICAASGAAPDNRLLEVQGGTIQLGKTKDHPLYGWDNEYGKHQAEVWDFKASQFLVSNGEFNTFVEADGYENNTFWTEEGKQWLEYSEAKHPLFWIKTENGYCLRTMSKIIEMPWNWPVEVNYLEAKAFCNWKAKVSGKPIRLPTENEWYRLRDIHDLPDQPYWQKAPGNINLEHWSSPCPVDTFQMGNFYDLIGNVWQWTETPISGFKGFEVHPYYDDFSTPTFDTQHNLIKGGSWISTGNEATRDSRYAFRRHFFQHAGLRYVETTQPVPEPESMYETDQAVSQYCELHYGKHYYGIKPFPLVCAETCLALTRNRPRKKVLELGCSVGRASFELAKEFEAVHGIDFSARFIRIAFQLQEKGYTRYELFEEGELTSFHEKSLNELGLAETASRIEFHQGDAANLKPYFTGYDLVLAANLIDRMVNPRKFLATIHKRINPGGLLVLASPYTWLSEFTEKEQWLGGFRKDGEPFTTLEGIIEILKENFQRLGSPEEIEFVIRETARKFQHSKSQLTVWQRHTD